MTRTEMRRDESGMGTGTHDAPTQWSNTGGQHAAPDPFRYVCGVWMLEEAESGIAICSAVLA